MTAMWYRIFGGNEVTPAPAAILEHFQSQGLSARGDFAGDEDGWFQAELVVEGMPLRLERFLAREEGIRAELNSWAAWLETREDEPRHVALMERMIQTAQLFTLERPGDEAEAGSDRLCAGLCRFLAGVTAGVWQADGRGFFAADGTLLLAE
jgi:hypothetical protein